MTHHHLTFKRTLSGNVKAYALGLICLFLIPFASAEPTAKAVLVKNQVTVESTTKQSKNIKRGHELQVGDVIRTGADARAIFRFYDGSVLTMGANSEITVAEFNASGQSKKGTFDFVKGAFRMITGAITETDSPDFTVNTPIGSIGIRGTDFWGGNLATDNSIDVVLLESKHVIEVSNQYGTVILKEPNQGTTLMKDKAPLSTRTWPEAKLQRAFKSVATE
ncbi:hypothetical protein NBRC116188_15400 [Oceaniserpentilla sp. 4NH20-0058]|uniref:FecR family protein n=1 Tax=Oceaniserpentilla sp. 4NH20-0058 TaxID=3127660 RepID=UPI0031051BF8